MDLTTFDNLCNKYMCSYAHLARRKDLPGGYLRYIEDSPACGRYEDMLITRATPLLQQELLAQDSVPYEVFDHVERPSGGCSIPINQLEDATDLLIYIHLSITPILANQEIPST